MNMIRKSSDLSVTKIETNKIRHVREKPKIPVIILLRAAANLGHCQIAVRQIYVERLWV